MNGTTNTAAAMRAAEDRILDGDNSPEAHAALKAATDAHLAASGVDETAEQRRMKRAARRS